MMMREPFDRLFSDVGERLDEHLDVSLMDPSYRVLYADGSQLDGLPDRERMRSLIASEFGEDEAEGFARLLVDLEAMYAEAIPRFVRKNFDGIPVGASSVRSVLRHRMMSNWSSRIARYVKDPKLRMLFSFQSMYLGLSPFEAPWVYAVLAYMEYGEGIWYPKGGLVRLAEVVARLAADRGAEIRCCAPVKSVSAQEVVLESGEVLTADAVIVNADLPYAEASLMGVKARERKTSCSAYVMYLDYRGSLPEALHHNVFFGADFKGNFEQIFNRLELPDDPAFYVAISSRSDSSRAPEGHENVMILVPCPNLDRPWSASDGDVLRERVFERLEKEIGFDASCVVGRESYGPLDYAGELNLYKGAAFGLSHHFSQSAFFRPPNKSRGIYFVGASTVPGNGLPMVLISAELVEERLARDFGGG